MFLKETVFQPEPYSKHIEIYWILFFTAGLVSFVGLNKWTIDVANKLSEHQNN